MFPPHGLPPAPQHYPPLPPAPFPGGLPSHLPFPWTLPPALQALAAAPGAAAAGAEAPVGERPNSTGLDAQAEPGASTPAAAQAPGGAAGGAGGAAAGLEQSRGWFDQLQQQRLAPEEAAAVLAQDEQLVSDRDLIAVPNRPFPARGARGGG